MIHVRARLGYIQARRCIIGSTFKVVIVNGEQQDVTILAYLFIPNQLYMFLAMSSPIIRST